MNQSIDYRPSINGYRYPMPPGPAGGPGWARSNTITTPTNQRPQTEILATYQPTTGSTQPVGVSQPGKRPLSA